MKIQHHKEGLTHTLFFLPFLKGSCILVLVNLVAGLLKFSAYPSNSYGSFLPISLLIRVLTPVFHLT